VFHDLVAAPTPHNLPDRHRPHDEGNEARAIKEEMAGKLKRLSNKPADLVHQISFELGYADLGTSKYSRTYKSVSKAGCSRGRINTGEIDSQSRNSGAKRVNRRNLTCNIQFSCLVVGSKQ
jgi:hypothetical protein